MGALFFFFVGAVGSVEWRVGRKSREKSQRKARDARFKHHYQSQPPVKYPTQPMPSAGLNASERDVGHDGASYVARICGVCDKAEQGEIDCAQTLESAA
jgi:hypothetical protein